MNKQEGINLLDLLVVLILTTVLMSVAWPNYIGLLEQQRQTAELNRLQSILQLARTLANLHQQNLTLCPTRNAKSCCSSSLAADLLLIDENQRIVRYFPGHMTQIAFPEQDVILRPLPARGAGASLLPCSGFTQRSAKAITLSTVGRPRVNPDPPSSLKSRCSTKL